MDSTSYKKAVFSTLSVRNAKFGLKQAIRKTATLNAGHALIGLSTEVGELVAGLHPYLSGATLITPAMLPNAREEMGDLLYYTTVACKTFKVKLPSTSKKVKLTGTITDNILQLIALSGDLLDCWKKVYYGRVLDQAKVVALLEKLVPLLYGLCLQLFNEPPAMIMGENAAKLKARYPEGFVPDCEALRDLEKEKAAVAAAKAKAKEEAGVLAKLA